MKMRKFVLFTCVSLLLFFSYANLISCTKTNTVTKTVHDTTIVTVHDTVAAAPSTLSLLCGKQWELDSVYWNYTGPGTGTLVYARGASGNSQNLDNYYTVYTAQGENWADENGAYYLFDYSFLDSDSINFKFSSAATGTDYCRILKLTSTNYNVYDSTAKALDIEILAP